MFPSLSNDSRPGFNRNTYDELSNSIYRSIKNNDKHTLQRLLERCKQVSFPYSFRQVIFNLPLLKAASNDQYKECLKILLDYCENGHFCNDAGLARKLALHSACRMGCDENILLLLQRGFPHRGGLWLKSSALHMIIERGSLNIVEYFLNNYSDETLINQVDDGGLTPLHKAVKHSEIIRLLLAKGANVLSADRDGNLPLHFACDPSISSNLDTIGLLVEQNLTTMNYQNRKGITPLMIAAQNGSDAQGARFLCENGAKTGIADNEGRMALHFAANSGNVELLQYVLQYTEISSIEQWLANIPHIFQAKSLLHSLIVCAIQSRNEECLEILLSSNKLSKSVVQTPYVGERNFFISVLSPIAYIFHVLSLNFINEEKFVSFLHLLFKYKVTILDEFSRVHPQMWPSGGLFGAIFEHPFTKIMTLGWPIAKQQHYFHLLQTNDVTVDYCLKCYNDNTQPFVTLMDYKCYYQPVMMVIFDCNLEALKLMLSASAILEPDKLLMQFDRELNGLFFDYSQEFHCSHKNIYKYLISLKPIYHTLHRLSNIGERDEIPWYPYSSVGEEFSNCTLQQLCRTTIRHHMRKYTLEDNLRDFRRNILELPLPVSLKDYLLLKS